MFQFASARLKYANWVIIKSCKLSCKRICQFGHFLEMTIYAWEIFMKRLFDWVHFQEEKIVHQITIETFLPRPWHKCSSTRFFLVNIEWNFSHNLFFSLHPRFTFLIICGNKTRSRLCAIKKSFATKYSRGKGDKQRWVEKIYSQNNCKVWLSAECCWLCCKLHYNEVEIKVLQSKRFLLPFNDEQVKINFSLSKYLVSLFWHYSS